ncbi:MAG: eukaryotic-like serine/threonine-protein kinase, partial [Cryptosporangiaceae bacterium]|nr:eukaryotic-like serine/threonine-protein kinase [Cryptosporangiaceae bacterium]
DPNGPGSLLIEQTNQPKPDAVADWRSREPQRRATTPGYVLIGIRNVPNYFITTADWEYLRTRGGAQVHLIIRGTKTSDHQAYGIHWETPAAQWTSNKHFFDTFTTTFTPNP